MDVNVWAGREGTASDCRVVPPGRKDVPGRRTDRRYLRGSRGIVGSKSIGYHDFWVSKQQTPGGMGERVKKYILAKVRETSSKQYRRVQYPRHLDSLWGTFSPQHVI